MKKSIIIIVFIILIGGIFAFKNILLNNKVDVPSESNNDVGKKSKMLSMMFEQTYGSGDYVVTTQNNWPTYDYVFNATLSNCENGTKLSWNDETDQVLISGYKTDKCHIYFDKVDPSLPTPTSPQISFDDNYNIIFDGSTSGNGDVSYYYSLDNNVFTKGNSMSVDKTSTIYAYAVDSSRKKSRVVIKKISVDAPRTGSVTTSYYCSKTNTYQPNKSCSYTYDASKVKCGSNETIIEGRCSYFTGVYKTSNDCSKNCSGTRSYSSNDYYTWRCNYDSNYYKCNILTTRIPDTYTCPNGGTLDGTNCFYNYTGTSKYYCKGTYYDTYDAAYEACKNYCSSGTYYNGKCYKMS